MLGLAIRSGIHCIIATGSFYILFSGKMLVAQPASYRLEPVSLEQGVSHNLIYCIKQDRQGFLWFGTMLGLVKYDGYTYTTFRHDPNDSTSLSNDDILALGATYWVRLVDENLGFEQRPTLSSQSAGC